MFLIIICQLSLEPGRPGSRLMSCSYTGCKHAICFMTRKRVLEISISLSEHESCHTTSLCTMHVVQFNQSGPVYYILLVMLRTVSRWVLIYQMQCMVHCEFDYKRPMHAYYMHGIWSQISQPLYTPLLPLGCMDFAMCVYIVIANF